jgi:hypothetical protein
LVVWTFVRFAGHELKRRRHFSLLQFAVVSGGAWVESSSRFVPGAIAPRSGVYRVHHYAHRMPHLVTVIKGMTFPECQRCGDKVRFVPMIAAEPIETDVDLARRDFVA